MTVASKIKDLSTEYGGYKALRWVQDHVVDRARLKEFGQRRLFYRQLIGANDLCFDIGSNIGDISAVLLELGARVVAVDPQPAAMRELKARLADNKNLICVDAGVADKPGELDLYLHDQIGTTSMVPGWSVGKTVGKIVVPVTTLDDLIARHGLPKYCKIDVEGFELQVLRGLSSKIPLMSLEFHADAMNVALAGQCLDLLERRGPLELNVVSFRNHGFAWRDWVARSEFEKRFAEELSSNPDFAYGDIFIWRSDV